MNIELTIEDCHWIINRMKAHYLAIKRSKKLTGAQKSIMINKLAERAHRLGFEDVCNWMGYTYLKIDLGENRGAGIFYPTDKKQEAFKKALQHLEAIQMLNELKPDKSPVS